jgi:hypothetical protein
VNKDHLLKMAAVAYGSDVGQPLDRTEDAFRLADHFRLMVDMDERRVRAICGPMTRVVEIAYVTHDRMAINRLAIVTLVAEIGEAMVR